MLVAMFFLAVMAVILVPIVLYVGALRLTGVAKNMNKPREELDDIQRGFRDLLAPSIDGSYDVVGDAMPHTSDTNRVVGAITEAGIRAGYKWE